MMKKIPALALCVAAAAAASGCLGFERKSTVTAPTVSGVDALIGSWTSSTVVPSPASCSDFKWNVTERTANGARGAFSATCANDIRLSGIAQGTLSGSLVNWNAQGNATAAGIASCGFSLAGTAELGVDSIRVPYSGDTCVGRVNGVEVLRKN